MQVSKDQAKAALEFAKKKTEDALPDSIPCGSVNIPKGLLMQAIGMLVDEFVDALYEYRVDVVAKDGATIKIKVK